MLIAPSPETTKPEIPSLMQAILYCNLTVVKEILNQLTNLSGDGNEVEKIRRQMILEEKTDGNRNILHAAVMHSFATSNKAQVDENPKDHKEQNGTSLKYERQWQELMSSELEKKFKASKDSKGKFLDLFFKK